MIIDFLKSKTFYAIIFIVIMALIPAYYYYNQYQKAQSQLNNLPKSADETRQLLDRVGKLIELPKDEDPLIATVSDVSKLKNQAFFQVADNGDKVLIYSKAKKAILYRPSTNIIIDVQTVNIKNSSNAPESASVSADSNNPAVSPTVSPVVNKIKLAIYNGTKITGLAAREKDLVLSKMDNINVVSTGNSKNDYTENLVIDLKGGNDSTAQQLAKTVSGKIVSLPSGEAIPSGADLLLIVGKK